MAEQPSKDWQIGFYRGSIDVLAKEQQELVKMVNITQQLLQMHIAALKELGVDLEAEMKRAQEAMQKKQATKGTPTPNADDLADRLA